MEEEVKEFHKNGGGCIVENTVTGISRQTAFIKHLAKATQVNIVAGTGITVINSCMCEHCH